jgi:2'-5' RNA ligase
VGAREQADSARRWAAFAELDRLRNRWIRTGPPPAVTGRRYYAWYLTFGGHERVAALAARYQEALELPVLTPLPTEILHMTLQNVGSNEEVDDAGLQRMIDDAGRRCAALAPLRVEIGPVDPHPEAVVLRVSPWDGLHAVREAVRAASAAAVPESGGLPGPVSFWPHVSIAYCNADGDAAPLRDRLAAMPRLSAVPVTVEAVELVALGRDASGRYRHPIVSVPLGTPDGAVATSGRHPSGGTDSVGRR